MTADIKYTVKYHARPAKKVAHVLFSFAVLIFVLFDLIWTPFKGLTPDMQALTMFYIIPDIFFGMNNIAILCVLVGLGLMLFKWRQGRVELTDDKLIIDGSYQVSIWLRNMWEVDVRDMKYQRWTIRLDSNVDAVQIKFKNEKEFEDFSEKLISLVGQFETVKLKTST